MKKKLTLTTAGLAALMIAAAAPASAQLLSLGVGGSTGYTYPAYNEVYTYPTYAYPAYTAPAYTYPVGTYYSAPAYTYTYPATTYYSSSPGISLNLF